MREPVRGISDGKFLPRLFISVQHITNQPKQGEQVGKINSNVMPPKPKIQKQDELSIPYRRNVNRFNSSQLKFFYENIVLRCENDDKPLKYFYINSVEIKQLKKQYDFELTHLKKVKGVAIATVPNDNDFVFVDDKHAAITSLLYHIRNAFVHNRVRLLDSGEVEIMDVAPARHIKKKRFRKTETIREATSQAKNNYVCESFIFFQI